MHHEQPALITNQQVCMVFGRTWETKHTHLSDDLPGSILTTPQLDRAELGPYLSQPACSLPKDGRYNYPRDHLHIFHLMAIYRGCVLGGNLVGTFSRSSEVLLGRENAITTPTSRLVLMVLFERIWDLQQLCQMEQQHPTNFLR